MDAVHSRLIKLTEDGRKRKGALAELVAMVKDVHENELIHDQQEADKMLRLAEASQKGVLEASADAKRAIDDQRADDQVKDVPMDQLMQLQGCADGAYEAMGVQVKLLEQLKANLVGDEARGQGSWKRLPPEQKVSKMLKGLSQVLTGLDSKDIKRQRLEYTKIKQAYEKQMGGPALAPGEVEEEEAERAASDTEAQKDVDSDDEYGGADLVEEAVRPVFGTRGASVVAGA